MPGGMERFQNINLRPGPAGGPPAGCAARVQHAPAARPALLQAPAEAGARAGCGWGSSSFENHLEPLHGLQTRPFTCCIACTFTLSVAYIRAHHYSTKSFDTALAIPYFSDLESKCGSGPGPGGLVYMVAGDLIVRFHIDDPVEAFPVHGASRTDGSRISALVVVCCWFVRLAGW